MYLQMLDISYYVNFMLIVKLNTKIVWFWFQGCTDIRKSIIYFGNFPIFWHSEKQSFILSSFSKAKYRALTTITCKLQWLSCSWLFKNWL